LPPGRYLRLPLIGYSEGLDAERAIAWRAADSFALREFLGLVLPEAPPDHSTISRTRRLIDLETHEAVFTWMLQRLADAGLVRGKTVGIDATTLEVNAALRSIVRRDTGETIKLLDEARAGIGIETPTQADLQCSTAAFSQKPHCLRSGPSTAVISTIADLEAGLSESPAPPSIQRS
jgi:transposase